MSLEKDILNLGSDNLDLKKEEEPKTFQEMVEELGNVPEVNPKEESYIGNTSDDFGKVTYNQNELKKLKQKRIQLKYSWKF